MHARSLLLDQQPALTQEIEIDVYCLDLQRPLAIIDWLQGPDCLSHMLQKQPGFLILQYSRPSPTLGPAVL
jgi:hypothetical protein